MSHLKPCPFCGSEPDYVTEQDQRPPFNHRSWIKCPKCRQSAVCSDWYGGDLGTTEASWNKRYSERESGDREKFLEHEYVSIRGLWCIDRDPSEVNHEWIKQNAFQLK